MSARIFSNVLRAIAMGALALSSYWSLRLAWADWLFRENTLSSVARATDLDPGNARYRAWLAELEEHDNLDPAAALDAAIQLDPSDSAFWIRRGLRSESQGDTTRAEQDLLQAARIDKLFAPRWALANFYVRAGDAGRFWPWAREALEMSYGDLSPLFQLCWSITQDPEIIRTHAIPPRHDVLGQYLDFLTKQNHLDAAQPVVKSFLEEAGEKDAPILLNYCDRLIERDAVNQSVALWNALCDRKLIPFEPLAPERGIALTNGGFQFPPTQQGFDWRSTAEPEITVTRAGSPPELRFHLSGKQPEHCELLVQLVPLSMQRQYEFRLEYRTSITGLSWRAAGEASFSVPESEDWKTLGGPLHSPRGSLSRLALVYDRPPGMARAEGEIWLRNASLTLASQ